MNSATGGKSTQSTDDKRLWIGNLDPRISEYQLLKLLQKYGNIEKFDMIFHRTGPLAGQPRGYAFVSFKKKSDALTAKESLNDQLVGSKHLVVSWANSLTTEEMEKPKPQVVIPALALSKEGKRTDPAHQIQAIEAKLKLMEKKKENELKINDTVATKTPVIVQFQYNKHLPTNANSTTTKTSFKSRYCLKRSERNPRPYSKIRR